VEVRDRVVVVTGGASGIGAALCQRFAAEGARAVVVADREPHGAREIARRIGGVAVTTDVAVEREMKALIGEVLQKFGAIDLFCSNAGVALGGGFGEDGGPFAPEDAWRTSFNVNVMAHVYAARALLPGMLARGSGYLLSTASAAGLLTDLGSQVYSVTKHAAVAFAEWLAIHYGDRGIGVSCLCPQGVHTPMLMGAAAAGAGEHLTPDMIPPEEVAEAVVAGLRREEFLILPHPAVREYFQRKAQDYDRWLRGMRRLRDRVYPKMS